MTIHIYFILLGYIFLVFLQEYEGMIYIEEYYFYLNGRKERKLVLYHNRCQKPIQL